MLILKIQIVKIFKNLIYPLFGDEILDDKDNFELCRVAVLHIGENLPCTQGIPKIPQDSDTTNITSDGISAWITFQVF